MTPAPWFAVRGSRNGSLVGLRWSTDGLAGDPPTTDLIHAELEIAAAASPGDTQRDDEIVALLTQSDGDPLADPDVVYALILRVLDSVRSVDAEPEGLLARLTDRAAAAATDPQPPRRR